MRYEGDIYRPPGEWKSYLLQATVGCSHNGCTFCTMYKSKRFRIRPMEEILADIDMAKAYYGDVRRSSSATATRWRCLPAICSEF